ncbi:hypothetical protein Aperf_G00000032417 [Anoplocephala perfoliata]
MPVDDSKPAAGDSEGQGRGLNRTLFVHQEHHLSTHSEPQPTTLQNSSLISLSVRHHHSVPLEFSQTSRVLSAVHASSVQDNFNPTSNQFDQNQRNNHMLIKHSPHRSIICEERKGCRPRSSTSHPRKFEDGEVHNVLPAQDESSNSESQIAYSQFSACQKAKMLRLSALIIILMFIVLEIAFLLLSLRVKRSCSTIALIVLQGAILSIIIIILESVKAYLCRSKVRSLERFTSLSANQVSSLENTLNRIGTEGFVEDGDFGLRYEKEGFHPAQFAHDSVNRIIESHCCFHGKQVVLNILATIFYCALIIVMLNGFFKIATESEKIKNFATANITSHLNLTDKRLQMECRNSDLNIGIIYLVIHLVSVMLRVTVCWCLDCGGCVRVLITTNGHIGTPRSMVSPAAPPFSSTLFPNRGSTSSRRIRRQQIGGNA